MIDVQERKITVTEFRAMEFPDNDTFIYELINGLIMRKASPKLPHQRLARRIAAAFERLNQEKQLGEYFFAPFDVFFDAHNQTQPDLFFIKKERSFIIDEAAEGIFGTPDLIVEIISPGSIRTDRVDKKKLYQEFAVKEYWLVDPNHRTIEQFLFANDALQLSELFEIEGSLKSPVLDDLIFEVASFFV